MEKTKVAPLSLQQRLDILFKKKAENNLFWRQNKINYDTWKQRFELIDNLIKEVK